METVFYTDFFKFVIFLGSVLIYMLVLAVFFIRFYKKGYLKNDTDNLNVLLGGSNEKNFEINALASLEVKATKEKTPNDDEVENFDDVGLDDFNEVSGDDELVRVSHGEEEDRSDDPDFSNSVSAYEESDEAGGEDNNKDKEEEEEEEEEDNENYFDAGNEFA